MVNLADVGITYGTPASKLRPPRIRHAELTRSAILDRGRVAQAEILAIASPAGFGKSTLAIQWASRCDRPVVWLTCDETDRDELVLLRDLYAAVQQAVPEHPAPRGPLTLEEPAYSRQVLPGFLRSVGEVPGAVTVVLDDVHLASGERTGHLLKSFVDALPLGSQIALVGRSLARLPLPLWRGQGRVVDVTVEDLSFGPPEIREALQQFTHDTVAADTVARVQETTEGWPVAVYLVSQAGPDRPLSSTAEFLESEVLDPLPADLRAFVAETAALGTVNVDLATAATGQRGAGHLLTEAIPTVLMKTNRGEWFHYHPLLQDCATAMLAREDPQRLQQVRSAAALWYLSRGFLEQAVRYALLSGDRETLGEVIWPAARLSLLQGRAQTVREWLDLIPEPTILQTPALAVTAAWTGMATSDFGNVLQHCEAALRMMPPGWRTDTTSSTVAPHLAILLSLTGLTISGPREAVDLARAAEAGLRAGDPIRALTKLIVGVNLALLGDQDADQAITRSLAISRSAGVTATEIEALTMLGLLRLAAGDDTAGCESIEAALQVHAFHDFTRMTATAGIMAMGEVALRGFRGSKAEAKRAIENLQTLRPELEPLIPWYRPLAGSILAFISVRMGDLDGFQRYIAWCEEGEAGASALCQRWAARARHEYGGVNPLRALSPAEMRVWGLLKGRLTLSEIADALFLSRETVKTHTMSIYRKLGVSSRREAQDLADSWE